MDSQIRISELIPGDGVASAQVAALTLDQRAALLRLAHVELEYCTKGADAGGNMLFDVRTRYPVLIEDRQGGGYLVAEKRPLGTPSCECCGGAQ